MAAMNGTVHHHSLVIIPAHQMGFWRYALLSTGPVLLAPSRERFAASLRPFFVMMKLVPMAMLDEMASARPMYL